MATPQQGSAILPAKRQLIRQVLPFCMEPHPPQSQPVYRPVFCLAEDRVAEEVGLRLALLSIREHCSEAKVFVFRPDPGKPFEQWLRDFPQVTLIPRRPADATSWNCKPQALLELLDQGLQEIIWLDSDLMLTRPCASLFEHLEPDTVVVAEEAKSSPSQGSAIRTQGWNLPIGREFPITMNTCVVRVTPKHRTLLYRWREMLLDPSYRESQTISHLKRPVHFFGDQDVFGALLGSAECVNVPVHFLEHGRNIIHVGPPARGYSLRERLAGLLLPIPLFVHNSGSKPWNGLSRTQRLQGTYWRVERLILETSPYTALAKKWRAELGTNSEWLEYKTLFGGILRLLSFGYFALQGLPLTLLATMTYLIRNRKRVFILK